MDDARMDDDGAPPAGWAHEPGGGKSPQTVVDRMDEVAAVAPGLLLVSDGADVVLCRMRYPTLECGPEVVPLDELAFAVSRLTGDD